MTLLAELVAASDAVASTRSRLAKTSALSGLLRAVEADEVVPAVGFLTGEPRQGKLGVGWATLAGLPLQAAAEPLLAISDLDAALQHLTQIAGPGSVGARARVLAELLGAATQREGDFIRRLLTGELRQGALEGVMVEAIAKAADVPAASVRRAHMLGGRLDTTAVAALTGGSETLAAVGLKVGRPVRPMLASTAADVAEALASQGTASVEWKLDGARIQIHRTGTSVKVFTRNLNDVTHRMPEVVDAAMSLSVEAVVLDGEALGIGEDQRPRSFQDTMSRFGTESAAGGEHPLGLLQPWFFDCLHLNGVDLLDRPLAERIALLESVAPGLTIPGRITDDAAEAAATLAEALAAGHEGVMVKAAGSSYEAGRRGKAWQKVKPVHTLDLVVLAVEWGSGRRNGWLSNIHMGARSADGGFVMVGKTFKGMTDETLCWQTERFLGLETSRSGHVVFLEPEQVVEVALDGVQRSTRYPGGVALRFARVVRYREDKAAEEADSIETVQAMLPS